MLNADTIGVVTSSLGDLTDKNLFAYCDNNPILRRDFGGYIWGWFCGKEFANIKGIRPDYVDFNTRTIYELKPYNPKSIKAGIKQLNKYNKVLGGNFKMVLEVY